MRVLPGVENDRIEMTEILHKYKKEIVNNSDDVLGNLQYIIEEQKEEEFERVHFHFSGYDLVIL